MGEKGWLLETVWCPGGCPRETVWCPGGCLRETVWCPGGCVCTHLGIHITFSRRLEFNGYERLCRIFLPPEINFTGNLLRYSVFQRLFRALVSLFESVTTFLEGAIERFHWLWLCKVISERKFHGTEVGPALFDAGGLRPTVVVMDAAGGGGGAPHLLVVVQFFRQVCQVCRNLFVP